MFKQIILPLVIVILVIIVVGSLTQKNAPINLSKYLNTQAPLSGKNVVINNKQIKVEIADTAQLRSKGLSQRNGLDADAGMFFVFDTKNSNPGFWMKDMLFPLDIIWISGAKIVKIDSSVPKPVAGIKDTDLAVLKAGVPVDYVLEVNAGFCSANNIKVGDSVTLPSGL